MGYLLISGFWNFCQISEKKFEKRSTFDKTNWKMCWRNSRYVYVWLFFCQNIRPHATHRATRFNFNINQTEKINLKSPGSMLNDLLKIYQCFHTLDYVLLYRIPLTEYSKIYFSYHFFSSRMPVIPRVVIDPQHPIWPPKESASHHIL